MAGCVSVQLSEHRDWVQDIQSPALQDNEAAGAGLFILHTESARRTCGLTRSQKLERIRTLDLYNLLHPDVASP